MLAEAHPSTIYSAVYSGVPVYELLIDATPVMRRVSDGYINATQILKVAGLAKPRRTKILEREVAGSMVFEKVQGGYGKYQGTWVPLESARELARRYGVEGRLCAIFEFDPARDSVAAKPAAAPNTRNTGEPRRPRASKPQTLRKSFPLDVSGGTTNAFSSEFGGRGAYLPPLESFTHLATAAPSDLHRLDTMPPVNVLQNYHHYPYEYHPEEEYYYPTYYEYEYEEQGGTPREPVADMSEYLDLSSCASEPQRGGRILSGRLSAEDAPSCELALGEHPRLPSAASLLRPADNSERQCQVMLEIFSGCDSHDRLHTLLSDEGADFIIDEQGNTALTWAAALGHLRTVEFLVTRLKADVAHQNYAGETALMRAVTLPHNYYGQTFEALLGCLRDAVFWKTDINARSVLHHVALSSSIQGFNGAADYYMLCMTKYIEVYVRDGGDATQVQQFVNLQDRNGDTALNIATKMCNTTIIQLLISLGANADIANSSGINPHYLSRSHPALQQCLYVKE